MNPSVINERVEPCRWSIAMVIDTYDDSRNGAVISTKRFVDLLRVSHDVSVITTGFPSPGKVLLPKFYPLGMKRIMKKMNTPLAIPSERILRRTLKRMDLVHVQFPFFLGLRSIDLARKLKIPVVTTFHIQAEHLAMNAGIHSEKFIMYCYKIWVKYLFNRSDAVICPSEFAEEELKRYGLKAPSVIISNGVGPMFTRLARGKPPEFKDKFLVLTVGRLAPEKKHETIIKGIACSAHCYEIQLLIIGAGPLKDKLAELGTILPNPPIILEKSQEDLVQYYNFSDLYIHAAQIEVECMSVLEAMACGLPVVIAKSSKSATSQFALMKESLFNVDDVFELASRIDYWIEHPQVLRQAGYQYSKSAENYSFSVSFTKLLNLYQCLIKR